LRTKKMGIAGGGDTFYASIFKKDNGCKKGNRKLEWGGERETLPLSQIQKPGGPPPLPPQKSRILPYKFQPEKRGGKNSQTKKKGLSASGTKA